MSRRRRDGIPLRWQLLLFGAVLWLRVWLSVQDKAPPVPFWFGLAATLLFGGAVGWMYHDTVARFRAWRRRWFA